ncbi:hypothetical protein BDZ91DRAFT_418631 [Kalaharituber pfeilii]|nr:hypothetical protein BDZ91DRAFT_418631 [Kalaharituber pfeilii]
MYIINDPEREPVLNRDNFPCEQLSRAGEQEGEDWVMVVVQCPREEEDDHLPMVTSILSTAAGTVHYMENSGDLQGSQCRTSMSWSTNFLPGFSDLQQQDAADDRLLLWRQDTQSPWNPTTVGMTRESHQQMLDEFDFDGIIDTAEMGGVHDLSAEKDVAYPVEPTSTVQCLTQALRLEMMMQMTFAFRQLNCSK